MSIETWFAFVVALTTLLAIPGPTILAVVSYSVAHGYRASVLLLAAVALGDSTALFVSIIGLGVLLPVSSFWFTFVKAIGGLYLLYLGIKMIRGDAESIVHVRSDSDESHWNLFVNTYLITALTSQEDCVFRS